jgi:hypothetical protein
MLYRERIEVENRERERDTPDMDTAVRDHYEK